LHRSKNLVGNFLGRGPQVTKENRSIVSDANRLGVEVDVHSSGKSVSNDERGRRQIIESRERIDPSLEVAIPRENRSDYELVLLHRISNGLRKRAGVAD